MKKITIIARGVATGGSGRVSAMLANYFCSKGYHVQYLAIIYSGIDYPLDKNIKYNFLGFEKHVTLQGVLKNIRVVKKIKEFHPDTIISFLVKPVLLSSILYGRKMIFSPRNDPNTVDNNGLIHYLREYEYKKSKAVVFQTTGAKKFFPDAIQKKGIIIANPLTENLPYWKDYDHKKRIISTCRLEKQKNIPLLLNAFAKFKADYPDYTLEICGTGPDLEKLKKLADSLGIEDSVNFLGFRTDVFDLMVKATIFVLSSDFEGLSNSMLEALAIGIPAICTDCPPGGAAMYIDDKVNGQLIPVNDVDRLYEAMKNYAASDELKLQVSENAVKIRDKLSMGKICTLWEHLL